MSPSSRKPERVVHCRRGQTMFVVARTGVELEIQHMASGAVTVRNARTRRVLRTWAPKDRDA